MRTDHANCTLTLSTSTHDVSPYFIAISFSSKGIFICYFIPVSVQFHFFRIAYLIAISFLFHCHFTAISSPFHISLQYHCYFIPISLPFRVYSCLTKVTEQHMIFDITLSYLLEMFRLHANYPIDQEEFYKTVRYID